MRFAGAQWPLTLVFAGGAYDTVGLYISHGM